MEEPVLSRLDRLDNILKQLEEIRGSGYHSPKSSTASTPSSGTLTSEDFSPRSLEKHCRPIEDVILEIGIKGTLFERIVHVEDRLLKLCLQLEEEEEVETEKKKKKEGISSAEKSSPRKGLKQLVKSCVKGKGSHKSRQ
ncbi:uncharacterized protein LOC113764048 [Coffea eugenioides]|uniref:uncharacterized protein LOC113764048 n=1 Tax=Coffea eugenioides TaxID=49369 RepID=UPI000F6090EF|nr:uncharacterized protein LOC113764048 [Coffea eugenioides]